MVRCVRERDPGAQVGIWPIGDGEMAGRIRAHDWASTPLGPIDGWPQSLKTVVDLLLSSTSMMSLVWGAEAIHLYNDAFAELLREHRLASLGRSAFETFARSREAFADDIANGMAGASARLLEQRYQVLRNGRREAAWFDVEYAPVRVETGRVGGVLWTLKEVTDRKMAEQALRESEARHRLLVENWTQAVWETDADGTVVADSPSWRNYTGQTLEEWLGYGWLDAIHPDDRLYAERQWREATSVRGFVDAEFRLRAPDGGWRWTNVRAAPVRDASGRVEKWAGMNIDIDARKRAEAALRESEAHFRGLVTAGRCLTYRMSGDWRQMYHSSGQGILPDTAQPREDWADLYLLPEDRPTVFTAIDEAIRTRSLFELEHRVRRTDGGIGWVMSRAVPILGPDGDIVEWFGVGNDVTARREAQDRLREAEDRYREGLEREVRDRTAELQASRDLLQATMDASTDMIQVFEAIRDADGRIVDFRWVLNNHTSESLYGKIEGESLLDRNPGVLVESIFDVFTRVTETGRPEQAEHRYVHEQFDGWFYQSVVRLGDGVATTTKDISAWKTAQADLLRLRDEVAQGRLRDSEERFRLLVESVRDYAIFTMDLEGIVTSWPSGAAGVYGWSAAEMLGRSFDVTFTPEDVANGVPRAERETAVRDGQAPNVRWHRRKGGARISIDGSTQAIVSADGEIRELIKIGQDVTAARQSQEALRDSEEHLRALVEGVSQLVWRAVDGGDWIWASPQWRAYTGQAEAESHGFGWLGPLHPEDRPAALEAWARVEAADGFEVEFRIRDAATGAYRWFQTRAVPRRDGRGEVVEWLGTSTDIHQLKTLQEGQAVMVAELQHRTRNLIAVVQGIAHDTMAETGPTEAFRPAFSHRLSALARVQGLLSRSEAEPITIASLLRLELDALGAGAAGDRVTVAGPEVFLRPSTVQTLALALHELATNARKYGALSKEHGRLAVTWSEHRDAGERRLVLDWIETGLEHEPRRPQSGSESGGYGRVLIEKALPHALGARTTYLLTDTGLRCRIDLLSRPSSTT